MFTCPWGTFSYHVLPFELCNTPSTFQRVIVGIFYDLIHECVEIYMDYFMTYGDKFDEALENLDKTLIRCKESNISLNNEKCFMMLADGIVQGHHISTKGIQVYPTKVQVILNFPNPTSQKQVQTLLGYVGYYRRFM
jgi:hypothetical protein